MAHASCGASFSHKASAHRFITQELSANHLQRHCASKIDVNRFVSNAHRATTELERFSIVARQDLVMFEAELRWRKNRLNGWFACWLLITENSAQRANRANFTLASQWSAANLTGPSAFCLHGPTA